MVEAAAVVEELGPVPEVEEPDISIEAAAEVVEAMAVAEIGSGWLCVPSYVVIRIDMSSAHLCTLISKNNGFFRLTFIILGGKSK